MNSTALIDSTVIYHIPDIPPIKSKTRHNHALAIGRYAQYSVLITYNQPPQNIKDIYDETYIIESDIVKSLSLREKPQVLKQIVRRSLKIVNQFSNPMYITSFDIPSTISGYLSDKFWVVDIFDDPIQIYYAKATTYPSKVIWRGSVWGIQKLLNRADRGYITLHPAGPYLFGETQRFGINAAPTSIIQPKFNSERDVLQGVWVGKVKLGYGIGILIDALANHNIPINIDVYGKSDKDAKKLAEKNNLTDQLSFHGGVSHDTVREAVADATVGFAILRERRDFVYSYPLKVGEYLAGGTIPVMSDFPGMRRLANNAGVYVKPNSSDLADVLTVLKNWDSESQLSEMKKARERAECIPWSVERIKFIEQLRDST